MLPQGAENIIRRLWKIKRMHCFEANEIASIIFNPFVEGNKNYDYLLIYRMKL